MNKSKLICVICRGFNKFFDAPKADGRTPVTFRTAIVIKKRDFYDEWDVYDALFWRIIQRITIDLNASIRIICPESETGEMQSLEELRTWQKKQAMAMTSLAYLSCWHLTPSQIKASLSNFRQYFYLSVNYQC